MTIIGKGYADNLKRVKNLVSSCINATKDTIPQNTGIFVTPLKERAICYECCEPIYEGGIKVLIINPKELKENEMYRFHNFHYTEN